jgi:Flp pilus assembly protein TadD
MKRFAPTSPVRAVMVGVAFLLAGCAGASKPASPPGSGYQTVAAPPRRDSDNARALNTQAFDAIGKGDYTEAEKLLKRALEADILFGPAHNNLGKVYFHQHKLYLAAWEFQYANKLMPNQPEPLNNLGLVFEAAGNIEQAVTCYTKAMGDEPDNPQFIGNLARAEVRRGDTGAAVDDLLRKLIQRDTRPEWVNWARERLELHAN